MLKPVGIGVVGAGMIGQVAHLSNYVGIPGCRVVAIADLRAELGQSAADRFGVPKLYANHHQLLDDPEIDAVVVVTKREATGAIVLDALRSGRHVLSEKPMAHTVEQAEALLAAQQANRTYTVGYMKRHDVGTIKTKALFDQLRQSGELGTILSLRLSSWCGDFACGSDDFVMTAEARPDGIELWPIAPAWIPQDRASDYAWFLNVFSHDLNLLRHLLGITPKPVYADFSNPNGRVLVFDAGGFPAVMDFGEQKTTPWREGIEVIFERGQLNLDFKSPLLKNIPASVTLARGAEVTHFDLGWSWAFKRQAEAFISDIIHSNTPIASGRDSVEDIRLAETIWRLALKTEG